LGAELERVASGTVSGVQLLPDFADATVGEDGVWLSTGSWQKLLMHIFACITFEAQVINIFKFIYQFISIMKG
jgi:hypothetical protein